MRYKRGAGDVTFDVLNNMFMAFMILITVYPFWNVLMVSLSSPSAIAKQGATLVWPSGFNLSAYKLVFTNPMILTGYKNTLVIVFAGTVIGVTLTCMTGYALSRKWLAGRRGLMLFITIPMFFSGGLIPSYLLNRSLGLYNNLLVLIIPGLMSSWYIIMMRTYFLGVPEAIEESARIDGANDWIILFRIMIPIATPIVAVMVLYYAVSYWNAWFSASIYIKDKDLFPLQLVLRNILIKGSMKEVDTGYLTGANKVEIFKGLKYATIIVSTVPILLVYPFLQKFFVKGVIVGSVKG